MTACPACASDESVEGRLMTSGDDGWVTYFYPKGLKFFTLNRSVSLENGQLFQACTKCGHVWSKVSPTRLKQLLQNSKK